MKDWKYINGAQVGNENITPVSKPNAPVKDPKKEDKEKDKDKKPSDPKDKEGYTFKERVKQVTGNSGVTEKLFHSLEKDVEKKEEDNDEKIEKLEKVGNKETFENFIKKLAKEKPELYQSLWNAGKMEALKAYYNKMVGNKTGNSSVGGGVQSETVLTETKDGSQYWVEKTSKSGQYAQYNLYYTIGQGKRHAGVFKDKEAAADAGRRIIGNAGYPILKSKVEELSKEGKSYEEVVKELLKFGFTKADIAQYEGYIREHIGNKKVGNYVVKTIKDFEIDIEKRPGENYWRWYVDHKNGDNLDSGFENSKEEAIRAAERKINSGDFRSPVRNNKTGNSASYDMTEKDYENEYKSLVAKRNNTQKGSKEYEDIQKRLEEIRKKIGRSPFGNSASDDKFAYVMREFDEGKLKTPDGKVVTDPAQAKAIAYSESKKTENGCARARNAMKCGNKEITLWNGNDSVLIKSDGTVLYLESNSFETDRDKFDSQDTAVKEMAKKGYKSK